MQWHENNELSACSKCLIENAGMSLLAHGLFKRYCREEILILRKVSGPASIKSSRHSIILNAKTLYDQTGC